MIDSLDNLTLQKIAGGGTNPICKISGRDIIQYSNMNDSSDGWNVDKKNYLRLWVACNQNNSDYLRYKDEIDDILNNETT